MSCVGLKQALNLIWSEKKTKPEKRNNCIDSDFQVMYSIKLTWSERVFGCRLPSESIGQSVIQHFHQGNTKKKIDCNFNLQNKKHNNASIKRKLPIDKNSVQSADFRTLYYQQKCAEIFNLCRVAARSTDCRYTTGKIQINTKINVYIKCNILGSYNIMTELNNDGYKSCIDIMRQCLWNCTLVTGNY